MSKKIRLTALLAAMVCSVTAMAGCGNSSSSSSSSSSGSESTASESSETAETEEVNLGKYDEPVTLTSFFQIATIFQSLFSEDELATCYYTQQQEEQTNIYIDYLWYAANTEDDAVQKTSMAIASGEIPDFMIVNSSQLALLNKTNLINRDLESLWETYASDTLKEWTTAEGTDAWESLRYDGDIIALPNIGGSVDSADMLWIRRDWLENLGLEIPTTMDELYDVMLAFKNDDPDGNGVDDTIGMTLCKDIVSTAGTGDGGGIFNSFGSYPKIWIDDGNGGIMYGSIADESKDALAWLAKAYSDGLIEQDFSSMDATKASEASVSGKSGVQWGAMWDHMWPLQQTVDNDPDADWIALPLLATENEAEPKAQASLGVTQYFVISAECEHPEAVIKLLNFWAEVQLMSNEEREPYMLPDESGALSVPQHYVMLKTWSPLKNLNAYYNVNKALEDGNTDNLTGEEQGYYDDVAAYLDGDLSQTGSWKTYGSDHSSFSVIDTYYTNDRYIRSKFTGSETASMQSKGSTVEDKVLEYFTQVIMGIKSLDDWDSFISEVNALGLEDMTEEANEWYASK